MGTAVITLPLHHPVRVAEDVALVDLLSGGRVDVGIGRGYQSVEFDTFGIPLAESRRRTDEAIEVLLALWQQPVASHHGAFWQFDDVRLQPRPVQRPHPPLYYASVSAESITHYAAQGIPFIVDSTIRTSRLNELTDHWRSVARSDGHGADGTEDLVAVRYVWVDATDDAAHDYVARAPEVTSTDTARQLRPLQADGTVAAGYEYWENGWHGRDLDYYSHDGDWDDRWIAGSPNRVVDRSRRSRRSGSGTSAASSGSMPCPRHGASSSVAWHSSPERSCRRSPPFTIDACASRLGPAIGRRGRPTGTVRPWTMTLREHSI